MLNMNPVVQVNVSIGASSTVSTVFDIGAILTSETGATTPLSKTTRYASYSSLQELVDGVADVKPAFATTTETYKAAAKYFGVTPAPRSLIVIFYDPGDSTASHAVPAEGRAEAIADAMEKGAEFYGMYYIPLADETDTEKKTNILSIVSVFDALERGILFYGFTGTVSSAIATETIPNDLFVLKAKRAVCMYCTSDVYDAAGMMGVAMGYSINAKAAPFALCYKGIASAVANDITQEDVNSIKAINANVFVARTKRGAKVENGSTSSGLRYDEMLYVDMIVNEIQNGLYDMIAESPTKLPLTDATTSLFIGEVYRILENYYNIGVLADASWRGRTVGDIAAGDIVSHGYYAYAESFDTQSDADRIAHKAMPITVLICQSGAVESIVINLDVQT